jgi:energy-coupling factor transport system substrate-specific component
MTIDRMMKISTMASIVVVLEKILEFLPNIQLTVVLLMAFIFFLSLPESLILVTIYTMLDILLGGISLYAIPMFIAWNLFAIIVFYAKGNVVKLILIGIIFPIIYSFILGLPYIYMLNIDFKLYYLADLPFTGIFIVSNVVTISWLYKMIVKQLSYYMGENHENLH